MAEQQGITDGNGRENGRTAAGSQMGMACHEAVSPHVQGEWQNSRGITDGNGRENGRTARGITDGNGRTGMVAEQGMADYS
jgi:hypothetical protein